MGVGVKTIGAGRNNPSGLTLEDLYLQKQEKWKWGKGLTLKPGTYEYRLVVDGRWMPDPHADHGVVNEFGERNSLLTVS